MKKFVKILMWMLIIIVIVSAYGLSNYYENTFHFSEKVKEMPKKDVKERLKTGDLIFVSYDPEGDGFIYKLWRDVIASSNQPGHLAIIYRDQNDIYILESTDKRSQKDALIKKENGGPSVSTFDEFMERHKERRVYVRFINKSLDNDKIYNEYVNYSHNKFHYNYKLPILFYLYHIGFEKVANNLYEKEYRERDIMLCNEFVIRIYNKLGVTSLAGPYWVVHPSYFLSKNPKMRYENGYSFSTEYEII